MHILGKNNINIVDTADKQWLRTWLHELTYAQWKDISDVLKKFPTARKCGDGCLLFQMKSRKYCIKVLFAFPQNVALIMGLKQQEYIND